MWNKLSFIFVTVITSSITIPSVHFFLYLLMVYVIPISFTFTDIVFDGAPLENIVEIHYNNNISVRLGKCPEEVRAQFISAYKVISLLGALIIGILNAIRITWWLFSI